MLIQNLESILQSTSLSLHLYSFCRLHGRPVELRPIRATPCRLLFLLKVLNVNVWSWSVDLGGGLGLETYTQGLGLETQVSKSLSWSRDQMLKSWSWTQVL